MSGTEVVLDNGPDPEGEISLRTKTWKCLRIFMTFLFSHIGLTALVVCYTIGGALVFMRIEEGEWLRDKVAELDARRPPVMDHPDYVQFVAISVAAWKASWMDDKVLRFWNSTHMINEIYPDDWSKNKVEDIRLWEIELNDFIIKNVARTAAEIAANQTAREMELNTNKLNAPNWSFPSAFLYALSVVTTIGYGHVAPYTKLGKVATIFYAIIGIPIMLAFLANIGDLLARTFRMVFEQVCLMKGCRKVYHRQRTARASSPMPSSTPNSPRPIRVQKQVVVEQERPSSAPRTSLAPSNYLNREVELQVEPEKQKKSVPILMCVVIMGVYLFGGAILFSAWEGWNYLDGLYFCFITLSTIGFGDMIPGASVLNIEGGKGQLIVCCLYILIGLAFLASCFNLLHDSAREGIKVVGQKIGLVKPKPTFGSRRPSQLTVV